jgi:hypothetical protein
LKKKELEARIIDLEKYVLKIENQLWEIQNPFKFEIGEEVKIRSELLFPGDYKVIKRAYIHDLDRSRKYYTIICCDTMRIEENIAEGSLRGK